MLALGYEVANGDCFLRRDFWPLPALRKPMSGRGLYQQLILAKTKAENGAVTTISLRYCV